MLNCIIVDDEKAAINIISSYVKDILFLNLVATTTNPMEGIEIINQQKIDLIFLDIQMPKITGLDFIRAINGRCKVIIISAYSQYALDGFELEVIDYLLKPVSFPRFLKAAQKAKDVLGVGTQLFSGTSDDFILLKGEGKGKFIKVELSEIDYAESVGNYTAIYCSGGIKLTTLITLKELEDKLPKQKFVRIQKSFIIAVAKISTIETSNIFLKNYNTPIPIGTSYRESFLEVIQKG